MTDYPPQTFTMTLSDKSRTVIYSESFTAANRVEAISYFRKTASEKSANSGNVKNKHGHIIEWFNSSILGCRPGRSF